jgi:Flp pilus assembly protein TadG
MMGNKHREQGAMAVEFVIMVPLFIMLLFGIIECGRYYNATITTTHAAREAVRNVALNTGSPQATASSAASPLSVTAVSLTTCPANGTGTNASVRVTHLFSYDVPLVKSGINVSISRTAVMRCGG